MENNFTKCEVQVHNFNTKENEWIAGEVVGYSAGDHGEDFERVTVKTSVRVYDACHPKCIRMVV